MLQFSQWPFHMLLLHVPAPHQSSSALTHSLHSSRARTHSQELTHEPAGIVAVRSQLFPGTFQTPLVYIGSQLSSHCRLSVHIVRTHSETAATRSPGVPSVH